MRTLLITLLVLLVGAPPAFAQPNLGPDYVQTPFGPMGPAGRDLLQKVALAGLWEGPAGRMGLEKPANPKVQEASRHLIDGHADLDRRTVELARTLNEDGGRARAQRRVRPDLREPAAGGARRRLQVPRPGTRNTAIRDYANLTTAFPTACSGWGVMVAAAAGIWLWSGGRSSRRMR